MKGEITISPQYCKKKEKGRSTSAQSGRKKIVLAPSNTPEDYRTEANGRKNPIGINGVQFSSVQQGAWMEE